MSTRPIKFRAWDNEADAMRDWDYLKTFPSVRVWATATFELMQFTGLHDKNGKEIYEGDVVHWKSEDDVGIGEVEMRNGAWMLCYNNPKDEARERPDRLWEINHCGEIIGNIYENPELLDPR